MMIELNERFCDKRLKGKAYDCVNKMISGDCNWESALTSFGTENTMFINPESQHGTIDK